MRAPRPLFLHRSAYRRRRLMDAARLLPWFGGGLMLLPLVLYEAGPAGAPTARVAVYLFLVWFGLILMAAAISRALDPGPDLPPEHPAAEDAE